MRKNVRALLSAALLAGMARPAAAADGLAEAAASSEAVRRLRSDVATLSSDAFQGRRAGTPEADAAGRWVAESFQKIGLLPGGTRGTYFQTFDFIEGVDLGPANALAVSAEGDTRAFGLSADFRPLAFSAAGRADAEVVFAGYGISAKDPDWDDYAGLDVKDKIVLVLRYGPGGDDPGSPFSPYAALRYKASAARDKGARALLVVTGPRSHGSLDELVALRSDAAFTDAGLMSVSIKRTVAESLLAGTGKTLEEAQRAVDEARKPASFPLKARLKLTVDVAPRRVKTSNVLGLLPGSDPAVAKEMIVVGAHYDHLGLGGASSLEPGEGKIHHGADDNASGVAGVLEIARTLVKKRGSLRRSLLFVAFGAEEEGTLGSLHFIKSGTPPLADVVAMINLDMVGRLHEDALQVHGTGTSPAWKALVEKANQETRLKLNLHPGGFGPSDHSAFYAAGKPVLFVFTGAHADYHRASDTVEKLNFEGEARVVRFLLPILEGAADASERVAFTQVKGDVQPSASRGFRVWVGSIPDYSEEGTGVKLSGVSPGSPAEKAGIKGGDTIVKFGEKEIRNIYDYTYALQDRKPGDRVIVVVKRIEDGTASTKGFELTLGSRPEATR